jgi:putative transposase
MSTLKYKGEYRRRLPHLQPPGASFFITFRLADSIPKKVWAEMRERLDLIYEKMVDAIKDEQALMLERERKWFREYEEYLHSTSDGQFWLNDSRIAAQVVEDFHHFDGTRYRLDAFCVMPNHVHTVLKPLPTTEAGIEACLNNKLVKDRDGELGYLKKNTDGQKQFEKVTFHSLASIMHSIKRHSAFEANRLINRSGEFWQAENYDRYCRNHEEWSRTIRYVLNNPVKAGLVKEWQEWKWSYCRKNM